MRKQITVKHLQETNKKASPRNSSQSGQFPSAEVTPPLNRGLAAASTPTLGRIPAARTVSTNTTSRGKEASQTAATVGTGVSSGLNRFTSCKQEEQQSAGC